jgi:CTP:phosphocholine cytidylyltransferase-like protein
MRTNSEKYTIFCYGKMKQSSLMQLPSTHITQLTSVRWPKAILENTMQIILCGPTYFQAVNGRIMITLIEAYRRSHTGNRLINYRVPKYLNFKQLRIMKEKLKRSNLQFFHGSGHSLMNLQKTVQLKKITHTRYPDFQMR